MVAFTLLPSRLHQALVQPEQRSLQQILLVTKRMVLLISDLLKVALVLMNMQLMVELIAALQTSTTCLLVHMSSISVMQMVAFILLPSLLLQALVQPEQLSLQQILLVTKRMVLLISDLLKVALVLMNMQLMVVVIAALQTSTTCLLVHMSSISVMQMVAFILLPSLLHRTGPTGSSDHFNKSCL